MPVATYASSPEKTSGVLAFGEILEGLEMVGAQRFGDEVFFAQPFP